MVNVNDPAWRAELRALTEAATPGPWQAVDETKTWDDWQGWWPHNPCQRLKCGCEDCCEHDDGCTECTTDCDGHPRPEEQRIYGVSGITTVSLDEEFTWWSGRDARFVAAAREAVPALLDAYERALEIMESMAPAIAYAMAHTWTEADFAAYRALIKEKVQ